MAGLALPRGGAGERGSISRGAGPGGGDRVGSESSHPEREQAGQGDSQGEQGQHLAVVGTSVHRHA